MVKETADRQKKGVKKTSQTTRANGDVPEVSLQFGYLTFFKNGRLEFRKRS
jgi:hypothetical protein